MKKILTFMLVVVFLVSMVFLGISCKKQVTETTAPETTAAETGVKLGGTVKVMAVTWPTFDALKPFISAFGDKYGVKIEIIETPYHEFFEKVMVGLTSKTGQYDLITYMSPWAPLFILEGFVAPLNDYLDNPNLSDPNYDFKDYMDTASNTFVLDGKIYALPFEIGADMLYYRTDLYKQYGIAGPPKNWDEYLAIAQKLTLDTNNDGDIDIWGAFIPAKRSSGAGSYFLQLLWSFGGELVDKDWNPTFNGPEGLKAMQYAVDLINKYKVAPKSSLEYVDDNGGTMFMEGKYAQVIVFTYVAGLADNPEYSKVVGNWWFGPIPGGKVGYGATWAWGVPEDSKNKEAAFKLAEYTTSKEVLKELGMAGIFAPRKSVVSDQDIIDKNPQFVPISEAVSQLKIPLISETQMTEHWEEVTDIFNEFQKFVSENKSI